MEAGSYEGGRDPDQRPVGLVGLDVLDCLYSRDTISGYSLRSSITSSATHLDGSSRTNDLMVSSCEPPFISAFRPDHRTLDLPSNPHPPIDPAHGFKTANSPLTNPPEKASNCFPAWTNKHPGGTLTAIFFPLFRAQMWRPGY
jgi:hypothetical protein